MTESALPLLPLECLATRSAFDGEVCNMEWPTPILLLFSRLAIEYLMDAGHSLALIQSHPAMLPKG